MDAQLQQGEVPVPSSLADVESLVQALYHPGSSQNVAKIQETLQRLQRSPDAWQLANSLLENDDEKVKFFGALTFTVKLNLDSSSLSEEDATQVLGRIINWLIRSVNEGVSSLVIRKLCSTLVVYFLRFSETWTTCVKHLICCFCANKAVPIASVEAAPDSTVLVRSLTAEKTLVLLWFSTVFTEEVGKIDGNSIKFHKFHDRLKINVKDVVALIAPCLESAASSSALPATIHQEAMKCFHSWSTYSHRAYIEAGIVQDDLKTLTKLALACLVNEDMYEATAELFTDILGNYVTFLNDDDLQALSQLLTSEWSQERYTRLVHGDYEFDSMQYGQLLLAFGDATVQDLARSNDPSSQQILAALEGLLHAEGYAVAEDLIFVPALEFWSTFVEFMTDSLYSEAEEVTPTKNGDASSASSWFSRARTHVLRVVENCWSKIQFPPVEIFDSWDSVDRTGFADARKDVADLLQSSYTLTGSPLFSLFTTMTVNALNRQEWPQLEASLFCIGTLSLSVDDDPAYETMLESVFGSPLFAVLADPATATSTRVRQTTLTLIALYDRYFEHHTNHLAAALTFLFQALASKPLALTASKSIHSLCSSCRQVLTPELDAFLQQYNALTTAGRIDGLVKERIAGAIAAIVQALPRDQDKLNHLSTLLNSIQLDVDKSLSLLSQGLREEAEACGLEALRCLTSIAKGLQAPSDLPVDLDATESSSTGDQYWTAGDGSSIQRLAQHIIKQLTGAFPNSGDIIEAACSVLRAGFVESVPGPFVFLPDSVVTFLLQFGLQSPRLGVVISTGSALVSSCASEAVGETDARLGSLVAWTCSILQDLGGPANDPEIAQSGLEFMSRLIPRHMDVLLKQSPTALEHFFMFSLKALTGTDPLPKTAAADFWSSFVSVTNLPEPLQTSTKQIIDQLGPFLAQALIYNVSGNAARSEVDKIMDPLKKLIVWQVRAKTWLEAALFDSSAQESKVGESERRIFLQKIISLRGARQTNQVVRDFWLACRGSNFAYAS